MTGVTAAAPIVESAESAARWRTWQARGAETDRRTVRTLRVVGMVIAAALSMWLFMQLA